MNIKMLRERPVLCLLAGAGVYALLLAFYVGWAAGGPPQFRSEGFIARSKAPLLSLKFYLSNRPFTTDFWYKLFGSDPQNAVIGQQGLSVICWVFLGWALAGGFKNGYVRWTCLFLFGAASIAWQMLGWSYIMRSESVTFSMFAMWWGLLFLVFVRRFFRAMVFLVPATLLFSFTRDNNPYWLLVCVGGIYLPQLLWPALRKPPGVLRNYSIYLAFTVMVCGLQVVTARIAARHEIPMINVIFQKILPFEDRTALFTERGMPLEPDILSWAGQPEWGKDLLLRNDPAYQPFRTWVREKATPVYAGFLLRHPIYMLHEWWYAKGVYTDDQAFWIGPPPGLFPVRAANVLWGVSSSIWVKFYPCVLGIPLLGMGFLLRGSRGQPADISLRLQASFVIASYVGFLSNALLIVHADADSISRHSTLIPISLLALGLWCLLAGLDRLLSPAKNGTPA